MKKKHSKYLAGALLTSLGGVCWGLSGSMGQYLFQHEEMDSRWLVPIRLGGAGIILLVYCFLRYGKNSAPYGRAAAGSLQQGWDFLLAPWKDRIDRRDLVVNGLAGVSACQFFYFLTIQLSTAGVGTILQDLSPIMILLVGCISARRAPRPREVLAIVLALFGVLLLTTHGNFTHMAVPVSALITGVLSAVCVTVYNIVPGRLLTRYPVALVQGWAFLMGSAALMLIFRPWHYHYIPSAMGVFGIFFVILVGNVIAFTAYMQGVKYIGPDKGILYGFAEPVTAAIVGTLFLHTPFTLWDVTGFAAIFLMLVMISRQPGQA